MKVLQKIGKIVLRILRALYRHQQVISNDTQCDCHLKHYELDVTHNSSRNTNMKEDD